MKGKTSKNTRASPSPEANLPCLDRLPLTRTIPTFRALTPEEMRRRSYESLD